MRLFMLLISALLLPLPTLAATWEFVTNDTVGGQHFIDRDSDTRLSDGHHRIWAKIGKKDAYRMYLYEFSCTGQSRVLEVRSVSGEKDGMAAELQKEWQYVTPDSILQMEEKMVCKK